MTHRHDEMEQRDRYGLTAAEGAEWRQAQPMIVIPRSTETPEERLARLDDYPEEARENIRQKALRSIALRSIALRDGDTR